jgi:hypothetical protein
MPCAITDPGHATNLTGVGLALAGGRDGRHAPVAANVTSVEGERIVIALADGTIEARCHDAARLDALLDAARAAGHATPRALFSAHEHQLFVEVDPALHPRGIGTEYVSPRSSTTAFAAFNLALPWHTDVPCAGRVAA